ncbi:MAG: hypothetical protein U1E10_17070 [Bdellovibrionales bacterium]|nr:hypothetical protein [Bdellovibrionales bacterium]
MFSTSKFSFSKSKMAVLSILALVGGLQVGCTDRELAAGAAGAVIGAIIVDSAHHRPPPPPPTRTCRIYDSKRCGHYRTYGGGTVYRCETETVNTCGGRYRNMGDNKSTEALSIGDISLTYNLQPESASKLIVALDQAMKAQDDQSAAAAWASIGVDLQEARTIGTAGSLSPATIDRMAQVLDQDVKATEMMVNGILSTAREQQAARHNNNTNM